MGKNTVVKMGIKSWRILEVDDNVVKKISNELNISVHVAKVLYNRGIKTVEECDKFLNPRLSLLPNPFLMKDVDKGVERIIRALKNGELIAIYGDYDADGITACALMFLFLKKLNANVLYYLPNRMTEGYSLNNDAIDELYKRGVKLVITVDCGTNDDESISYGKKKGMDFIITDHHLSLKPLPQASAVINPRRRDCAFPYKDLAGVGVAYYFLIALRSKLREQGAFSGSINEPNLRDYLDLVAIGTIADMMPLTGINRIFVKEGIKILNKRNRKGIKVLMEELFIEDVNVRSISFRIAPRINAPGRIDSPLYALELLLSDDNNKANHLAQKLKEANIKRKSEEDKILQAISKDIEQISDLPCLVFYDPNWHLGVLGIVASKILDKYNKPVVVLTDDANGHIKGSARSFEGFPLNTVFQSLSHLLEEYGGHSVAAGIKMKKENLDKFTKEINNLAKDFFYEKSFCSFFDIDDILDVKSMDEKFFKELSLLEPFGQGNPEPIFLIEKVEISTLKAVGTKENHLKLTLKKDGVEFSSIGFAMYGNINSGCKIIDILGMPKINEFNGQKKWDFYLKDLLVRE